MSQTPSDPPGPQGPGGEPAPTDPAESWTPPGTPPRTGTGGTKTGLLVVAALVVVAVIGSVIYLVTETDGGGTSSPEGTVEAFFAAAQEPDCEKLVDLISEKSWSYMGAGDLTDPDAEPVTKSDVVAECEDQATDEAFPGGKIVSANTTAQDDKTATVEVTFRDQDGEETTEDMPVVKEDGRWKVDLLTLVSSALGEMSEEDPDVGG